MEIKVRMENAILKECLMKSIQEEHSLEDRLKLLKAYKSAGGRQKTAYEILEEIRSVFMESGEEEKEDCVLELMDIAVGYCHPTKKIWETDLKT